MFQCLSSHHICTSIVYTQYTIIFTRIVTVVTTAKSASRKYHPTSDRYCNTMSSEFQSPYNIICLYHHVPNDVLSDFPQLYIIIIILYYRSDINHYFSNCIHYFYKYYWRCFAEIRIKLFEISTIYIIQIHNVET